MAWLDISDIIPNRASLLAYIDKNIPSVFDSTSGTIFENMQREESAQRPYSLAFVEDVEKRRAFVDAKSLIIFFKTKGRFVSPLAPSEPLCSRVVFLYHHAVANRFIKAVLFPLLENNFNVGTLDWFVEQAANVAVQMPEKTIPIYISDIFGFSTQEVFAVLTEVYQSFLDKKKGQLVSEAETQIRSGNSYTIAGVTDVQGTSEFYDASQLSMIFKVNGFKCPWNVKENAVKVHLFTIKKLKEGFQKILPPITHWPLVGEERDLYPVFAHQFFLEDMEKFTDVSKRDVRVRAYQKKYPERAGVYSAYLSSLLESPIYSSEPFKKYNQNDVILAQKAVTLCPGRRDIEIISIRLKLALDNPLSETDIEEISQTVKQLCRANINPNCRQQFFALAKALAARDILFEDVMAICEALINSGDKKFKDAAHFLEGNQLRRVPGCEIQVLNAYRKAIDWPSTSLAMNDDELLDIARLLVRHGEFGAARGVLSRVVQKTPLLVRYFHLLQVIPDTLFMKGTKLRKPVLADGASNVFSLTLALKNNDKEITKTQLKAWCENPLVKNSTDTLIWFYKLIYYYKLNSQSEALTEEIKKILTFFTEKQIPYIVRYLQIAYPHTTLASQCALYACTRYTKSVPILEQAIKTVCEEQFLQSIDVKGIANTILELNPYHAEANYAMGLIRKKENAPKTEYGDYFLKACTSEEFGARAEHECEECFGKLAVTLQSEPIESRMYYSGVLRQKMDVEEAHPIITEALDYCDMPLARKVLARIANPTPKTFLLSQLVAPVAEFQRELVLATKKSSDKVLVLFRMAVLTRDIQNADLYFSDPLVQQNSTFFALILKCYYYALKKNHSEFAKIKAYCQEQILSSPEKKVESVLVAFGSKMLFDDSFLLSILQKYPRNFGIIRTLFCMTKSRAILDEIERHLRQLIVLSPTDGMAHYCLGEFLKHEQKPRTEYMQHYFFGLRDKKSQSSARLELQPSLLSAERDTLKLQACFSDIVWLQKNSSSEEVQLGVGEAFAILRRIDLAEEVLRPFLAYNNLTRSSWKAHSVLGEFYPWKWKDKKKQFLNKAISLVDKPQYQKTSYIYSVKTAAMQHFIAGDYENGMRYMKLIENEDSREVRVLTLKALLNHKDVPLETLIQKAEQYCDLYEAVASKDIGEISIIGHLAKRLLLDSKDEVFRLVRRLTRAYVNFIRVFECYIVASLAIGYSDDFGTAKGMIAGKNKSKEFGDFIELLLQADRLIHEQKWEDLRELLGDFTLVGLKNMQLAKLATNIKNKLQEQLLTSSREESFQ